jgi:hypothetical protein
MTCLVQNFSVKRMRSLINKFGTEQENIYSSLQTLKSCNLCNQHFENAFIHPFNNLRHDPLIGFFLKLKN